MPIHLNSMALVSPIIAILFLLKAVIIKSDEQLLEILFLFLKIKDILEINLNLFGLFVSQQISIANSIR